jgi:hypothetical protein
MYNYILVQSFMQGRKQMSNIIDKHKELSRRVLNPSKVKPSEQKTSGQNQLLPMPFIISFSLGTVLGISLFMLLWILTGFSKVAVIMPFLGGMGGIVVEIIRQRNKFVYIPLLCDNIYSRVSNYFCNYNDLCEVTKYESNYGRNIGVWKNGIHVFPLRGIRRWRSK